MTLGVYGRGPYGLGTYGAPYGSFKVVSAEAANPYTVIIHFNQPIDLTYPLFLDSTNYTIPGLTVTHAVFDSPNSIRLTTTAQAYSLYVVTVVTARSATGKLIDTLYRTASFTGHGVNPGFLAVALTKRRVRIQFSSAMQMSLALSSALSYTVTRVDGLANPVIQAYPEQPIDALSVILILRDDLEDSEWYRLAIVGAVKTTAGLSLVPSTNVFQWTDTTHTFSIELDRFTGEVQGGLFGNPLGLVFFSPALDVPAANSVIQVDSVDVCTTAYDTYTFPAAIDPFPLYTWSPTSPNTGINQAGISLWAPFPRLVEARFDIAFTAPSMVEYVLPPLDGPATATVAATWDPSYVAFLNNPYMMLGPNPPILPTTMFICTNNLGPIPPGPSVTYTL